MLVPPPPPPQVPHPSSDEPDELLLAPVGSESTEGLQGHNCICVLCRTRTPEWFFLLRISDDILRAVDNKKVVIIILLDLSAAFDTIDHEVLLQRLHVDFKVDATALAWFRSYLHCRRQMVNINGTLSEEALLKYGVPQGSVLGPLLFTLYIAPLGEIARHHGLQVHFYADDMQLYVTFDPGVRDDDADAISHLTTCLTEIRQWMVLNFVKLNDDKTEYLVISSPHMRNKIVPQNLQVGCVSVPPSENARNLGVFFDQCMKMDKHISKVCQTTYYQLRNISAIRSLLTRFCRRKPYSFLSNL